MPDYTTEDAREDLDQVKGLNEEMARIKRHNYINHLIVWLTERELARENKNGGDGNAS